MSKITLAEIQEILDAELPLVDVLGIQMEDVRAGECRVRMAFKPDLIRPGGTIAGPAMMALADLAMYGVVLSLVGRIELAVTTNLNINFLRKPAQADMLAVGRLLKGGKRLVVVEVDLYSEAEPDQLVAHVTGTYSVPPQG
ncbi:PaaI family thioesterase [Insolitispirillum peregrinum]|uniref:PaaI family thioesterase n=1 Tax=Insolitispirillum peregrinum TaxID=80876 RepID=UPI0036134F36